MPTFEFTSPDGKTYEVQGPAGATQAQAFQMLQKQISAKAPGAKPTEPATAPPKSDQSMSGFVTGNINKGIAGLVGSGVDTVLNVGDLAKAPLGIGYHEITGKPIPKALEPFDRSKYLGSSDNVEKGMRGAGMLDDSANPRSRGQELAALGLQMAPGLIPGAPKAAKAGIAKGAEVANKALPSFAKQLTPEMQALNAKAREFGIVLQPHQLTDNKFVKILGETINYVPASGSKNESNRLAFETALVNQIGGEGKRLTPKVFDSAMRKSGTTIDAITRKYDLTPSKEFVEKLADHVNEAKKLETPDVANAVDGWVNQVTSKMEDGPMNGTAFRKLNTALKKKISSTDNGDLRNALSDLQDTLLKQFNEGVTDAKDATRFKDARTQYAKAKTLAPIVGDPQGISPSKLLSQVRNTKAGKERYARGRAGDIGTLGDIGQRLKDPSSSMTSERGLVYGGLAGLGTIEPHTAAMTYGGANLYNRLGPYFMRPDAIPVKP